MSWSKPLAGLGMKTPQPAVLLWGINPVSPGGSAVLGWLKGKGIRTILLKQEDADRTPAGLLGLPGTSRGRNGSLPDEPMAVLYMLPEPLLDGLLTLLRERCPIPLKAVVTPHNMSWSLADLARELQRERVQMEKRK